MIEHPPEPMDEPKRPPFIGTKAQWAAWYAKQARKRTEVDMHRTPAPPEVFPMPLALRKLEK